jgi:hypothetical protein
LDRSSTAIRLHVGGLTGRVPVRPSIRAGQDIDVIVAAVGAIVSDWIGYEIGRHDGRTVLERYGRILRLKPRHLARAEAFFA